jgi:hypothetical protein
MGGDDSQKLLPWRGGHSSPGRSQPLALPNQHSTSTTPKSEDPAAASIHGILSGTYSAEK